jgi:hypothetical protein
VFYKSNQLSFSTDHSGLDADIDIFNPNLNSGFLIASLLHGGLEVLPHKVSGGLTNPCHVAFTQYWECEPGTGP